ncbi:hypothetical protein [Pasteurella testudinis]|uniref:hypothetical protein n=1 Tax=Pasteurella testudinis TaxID=761 RepID=UPI0040581F48
MNNHEINLLADSNDYISIDYDPVPSDYGEVYYNEGTDNTVPWWEQGVLVSYEDIIAAERGEYDDDY